MRKIIIPKIHYNRVKYTIRYIYTTLRSFEAELNEKSENIPPIYTDP